MEEEISAVNERIKEIIYNRFTEEIAILTSIPGIGFYTAGLLIAEIVDVKRFPSFRKLACYCGLIPRMYESGKRLLVIKMDKRLKEFYERISRKKGHNKAIVALAKKLLRIIYTLLKRNEAYRSIA
ncbi:MAG: transposase [Candidatus Bathyarchaeia archaeon]